MFVVLATAYLVLWCVTDAAFVVPPINQKSVLATGVRPEPETTARNVLSAAAAASPEASALIAAAERFMNSGSGYFSPLTNETFLAEDFVFRGPVIGPLTRDDYAEVLGYFRVYEAFPDIKPNCFGFTVDPSGSDPFRVWFFVRATGTYRNPLGGALGRLASWVTPPDGREYRGSTEGWSLTFNEGLQVRRVTAGYVVDRFEDDAGGGGATTDGRGLTFGVLSTLGLPLPSAPGDPRLRLVQWITGLVEGSGLVPKAVSDQAEVPNWWKDRRRGADP